MRLAFLLDVWRVLLFSLGVSFLLEFLAQTVELTQGHGEEAGEETPRITTTATVHQEAVTEGPATKPECATKCFKGYRRSKGSHFQKNTNFVSMFLQMFQI